jgi:glutamate dehydrogenase/leucine dehydrogenase
MAQNALSGVRTHHICTCYHYVRENLEEVIINIKFVKSIENNSDIFTNNVSQEIYDKQVTKFLGVHARSTSTERFSMGGCWRYIPHVHIILDISSRLSNGITFKNTVRDLVQLNL